MTPDKLGGDITNPQSLNRYAYVLNNPASFNDPLGLGHGLVYIDVCAPGDFACDGGGIDTNPGDPCSYVSSIADASCQEPPGLWDNGQPIFPPYLGGGFGGWGGGTATSTPPNGQPPLAGGGGNGFISPGGAAVWDEIEQDYPLIAETVWPCAFLPVCQEGLATGVAGAAVGVAVGYGVVKLQNYIHQMRRVQSNEWTDRARAWAQQTRRDPCEYLAEQRNPSLHPENQNPATLGKIRQAEKFLGCRNVQKRIP